MRGKKAVGRTKVKFTNDPAEKMTPTHSCTALRVAEISGGEIEGIRHSRDGIKVDYNHSFRGRTGCFLHVELAYFLSGVSYLGKKH